MILNIGIPVFEFGYGYGYFRYISFGFIIFCGVSDIIMNITMIIMFIKRLKMFKAHTKIDKDSELYSKLIRKYTFLVSIIIISTFICYSLNGITYITLENYQYKHIIYTGTTIDGIINFICAYFSMGFAKNNYKKYCYKCEKLCC